MTNIKRHDLHKLLSIIPAYPGTTIFHMAEGGSEVCFYLEDFCKKNGYVYSFVSANEEFIKELYEAGFKKARKIKYTQQRYNQHSRLYDFVFIDIDLFSLENQEFFLKKIYALAKNGAKILFFFPKTRSYQDLEKILEDGYFVAINPIDDLFENYTVLGAQKMHGWGRHK